VRHVDITEADLTETLARAGVPTEFAAALAYAEGRIRAGAEDRTTSTVREITGSSPRTFRDFVLAHRAEIGAASS
jgi:hypothetical protein